ncbi:hypothetical protein ACEWY4_013503 [Coilia grayii]|uniref:RING-type domain-containing protein n=1 Tax=Coilia grayii TaxID=363190 RepID=A0ABD1JWH9_9TELE
MAFSGVWHTQGMLGPSSYSEYAGTPGDGQPECTICFSSYDNVFKTPKLLDCTHTFCLECLARMLAISDEFKKQVKKPGESGVHISCPVCRHPTAVPRNGPPALVTSKEVLESLPHHLQREEHVSMMGRRLCYLSPVQPTCICIDIGESKPETHAAAGQEGRGRRRRAWWRCPLSCWRFCASWKRQLLLLVFVLLLAAVLAWPLVCIINKRTLANCLCCGEPPETTTSPPVKPLLVSAFPL